jgi:hypothetical protein
MWQRSSIWERHLTNLNIVCKEKKKEKKSFPGKGYEVPEGE